MIKLIAILIGLLLFSRPVFPADETNKTPPAAQDATGERAGASEVAVEAGARLPALGEASPASPTRLAARPLAQRGEQGERDPFWPIGFFPASMPGGASEPAQSVRDKKTAFQAASLSGMLRIGGVIKKGNKFYATINGFTVQTGEVISAVANGEVYKFVVEKIDFNKVQFKPLK